MTRLRRLLVLAALLATPVAARAHGPGYTLVVHEQQAIGSLTRAQVANIFLKRTTRLPNGRAAVPVDLPKGNPVREAFSRAVLGRSASNVVIFWQQQIFAGKDVPPPERPGDAEVLAFVRANPGAIGYVSANAQLGHGVRIVQVN